MDNFTHALAGLLVAEALLVTAGPRAPNPARGSLLFASALANNLQDFDFAYSSITPGKLGYLLHHRGHSHTLVIGVLLGAAIHWPFRLWLRHLERTGAKLSRFEYHALLGLCLAGPLFHIALDATNNYGVHPFWPVYSGWFFGDSVFIVEPLLWVAALPALIASARTTIGRGLWCVFGLAAFGSASVFADMEPALVVASMLATTLLSWVALRTTPRRRLWSGIGGWALATAAFALGANRAESTLLEALERTGIRRDSIVDVVTTPRAANPLCYSAIGVALTGDRYRAILTQVSTLPWLLAAGDCPADRAQSTAVISRIPARSERALEWHGSFEGALSEFAPLVARCDVAAALGFFRVPFWQRAPEGKLILGDLRYDRSKALDFAELELPAQPECPPNVPPWLPPRRELIYAGEAAAGAAR